MVRQIGHAVDMRVNRLSLMRIDRRFRKPDLLAVRTLALQLFRMALGVIGALQRVIFGRRLWRSRRRWLGRCGHVCRRWTVLVPAPCAHDQACRRTLRMNGESPSMFLSAIASRRMASPCDL